MKKRIIALLMAIMVAFGLVPVMTAIQTTVEVQAADDYPAKYKNAAKGAFLDAYGFYNRHCTSAVAFWLNNRLGVPFSCTYGGVWWGDAKTWANSAKQIGIPVDRTPAVGAVAYWTDGTYGHVALVTAVNGDKIVIDEYNYNSNGQYHTREISASNPAGYIHFKDQPQACYLDLNWEVDGNMINGDVSCATVDVYINGKKVATGVSDYFVKWPVGTEYTIKNIKAKTGYSYAGEVTGTTKGSIGNSDTEVRLSFVSDSGTATGQVLADGIYVLATGNDPNLNYVLKLEKSKKKNGTKIVLGKLDGSTREMFHVKYLGDGYYSIKNIYSGKTVHIKNEAEKNSIAHIWDVPDHPNARWKIKDAGNGYFTLMNEGNYSYLDNSGGTVAEGNTVWTYWKNGTDAQKWKFIPIDALGTRKIYSVTATIGLNLRSGASKSYKVIVCMPYGKEVQLLEDAGNGWFKVSYNGTVGYCMKEYLKYIREEVCISK